MCRFLRMFFSSYKSFHENTTPFVDLFSHFSSLYTSNLILPFIYINYLEMGYYSYRKRPQPRCPVPIRPVSWKFLDFPRDVRNLIYDYLLVDNSFGSECRIKRMLRRKHLFPEIMRTCQQIHDEAVHILYCRNYFTIEINYDESSDWKLHYIDAWLCLSRFHHALLMQNWRILIKKSEYPPRGVQFSYEEIIPWKLRVVCMTFQTRKIGVSNLLVYVEDSFPLITLPLLDLLSPLKELRVGGKLGFHLFSSQQSVVDESLVFEYFQNMIAIMKSSPKRGNLDIKLQEDVRVAQSQFFIQDLETVARIFQKNVDDERCIMELKNILRMLERDRAKEILQNPKRLVREELYQYLGLLEDIFNSLLHRRIKTRSNSGYDGSDEDLIAMSKARRWLYMRPEYLAWIQRHDRNALYSRGPIYHQEYYWKSATWYNEPSIRPSSPSYHGTPEQTDIGSSKSSPPSSDITGPSRRTKIFRPHNPNEQYAMALEDLFSAEDMSPGLRDQAATCTLKFQVSGRQHRQAILPKMQRQKKPRKGKWVGDGGKKLGDCLELYEECF